MKPNRPNHKRPSQRAYCVLLMLAITTLASLSGCIDNKRSFVILFAVPPDPENNCEYEMQDLNSASMMSYGLLDLAHPVFAGSPRYDVAVQVHNHLLDNANNDDQVITGTSIQLQEIQIRYRWIQGREILEQGGHQDVLILENVEYNTPISGTVGPASSVSDPGQLLISMNIIPAEVGTTLASLQSDAALATLGVKIRLIGTTLGDMRIESNWFLFPVNLCWGCIPDTPCADSTYPACKPGQDGNNLKCSD